MRTMSRVAALTWTAHWRSLAGPLIVGAVIAVLFTPLSPAYDLAVFVGAGHALLHGASVYPPPGSAQVYSGSSFVYPYFAVAPFVPLALVSRSVGDAAFFAVSFGALGAACLAQSRGDGWRAALVLATSFAVTGLQLGALSPLLAAGVVFLWRLRDRPVALGVLAGPVIGVKLFLAPLLLWLLIARRRRALAAACAVTGGLVALGFVLGPLGPGAYLELLSALGHHEARAGFGLIGALLRAGLTPSAADVLAAGAAGTLMLAAHRHHCRHGDERVVFCAALLAALALSPVVWSHYLLLLGVALLVLDLPRRWFAVLLALSWMAAPAHGVRIGDDSLSTFMPALWILAALVVGRSFWAAPAYEPPPGRCDPKLPAL
jgi:alpha-1,2-mannosyltransferase